MNKKNHKQLKFDTSQNIRSGRVKRFALGFCAFLLIFAAVSVLLLFRYYDYDLTKIKKQPEISISSVAETTTEVIPEISGRKVYLLFGESDDGKELRFAAAVGADLGEKNLSVLAIDCTATVGLSGRSGTLEDHFLYGGPKLLKAAVEELYGIKIDKYVGSTDTSFCKSVNIFGGLIVDVPSRIDIRTDSLTAIIQAGKQTMSGETLLKYFRANESRPGVQADTICSMLTQYLTADNYTNADNHFGKVIDLVDSDISIIDFAEMKPAFKALIMTGEGRSVEVVPQLFAGGEGQ